MVSEVDDARREMKEKTWANCRLNDEVRKNWMDQGTKTTQEYAWYYKDCTVISSTYLYGFWSISDSVDQSHSDYCVECFGNVFIKNNWSH